VVERRVEERKSGVADRDRRLPGRRFDVDPEGGVEVGAATAGADGAIAVLRNPGATARGEKCRQRTDVVCPQSVAAGTAGVQQGASYGEGRVFALEDLGTPGNLRRLNPFRVEGDEKCCYLGIREVPIGELLHKLRCLVLGETRAVDDPGQVLARLEGLPAIAQKVSKELHTLVTRHRLGVKLHPLDGVLHVSDTP
jgi:hypothetical protein